MINFLKILIVMALLPLIVLGSIVGLLWHAFMAGVMRSELWLASLLNE